MLEVQYQNTIAELRSCTRVWPLRMRFHAWAWQALFLLAGLIATLLFVILGDLTALAGACFAVAVMAAFFNYTKWQGNRRAYKDLEPLLRPMTVRINPEQFDVSSDYGWLHLDWELVETILITSRCIYFMTGTFLVFIVPKRAFATAAQADQFSQSALAYRSAVQSSAAPRFAPGIPPLSSNQDALRVTYRNTPEEFISVQFEGLQKTDQPTPKKASLRPIVLMLGGSLVLALMSRSGAVPGVLVGASLALTLLVIWQRLMPRLSRRGFQRRCLYKRTLTISAAGLSMLSPNAESFETWQVYSHVDDDARFIAFFDASLQVGLLVPRQAFASAAEADRFAGIAKRLSQDAHPAEAVVLPAHVETENPYQSPISG